VQKNILIIVAILVVGLIGASIFLYVKTPGEISETSVEQKSLDAERDEHGCLLAEGFSWCEAKQICLRAEVEPCEEEVKDPIEEAAKKDQKEIKQALLDKHGWTSDSVIVTITENNGTHAFGSVQPAGDTSGGGGLLFAAKVDGKWKIAWDGNGTINCSDIEPYDFPLEMLPECFDETLNQVIQRQ